MASKLLSFAHSTGPAMSDSAATITVYATYDNGTNSLVLPFQANVTYFEILNVSFSDSRLETRT